MQYTADQVLQLLKTYRVCIGKLKNNTASMQMKQQIESLEKSIAVLDEENFSIIKGIFVEGVTYQKMSERIGLSKPGVQSRIKAVAKLLAKMMSA